MPRTAKKRVEKTPIGHQAVAKKATAKKATAKKATAKKATAKKATAKKTSSKSSSPDFILHVEELGKNAVLEGANCKALVHSVRLSAGSTLNLGDYESARFEVGVTLSALDGDTTPDQLAEAGWDFIRKELSSKVSAVRAKRSG